LSEFLSLYSTLDFHSGSHIKADITAFQKAAIEWNSVRLRLHNT